MVFEKGNQYWKNNVGRKASIETKTKLSLKIKEAYKTKKFGFPKGHRTFEGTEQTQFKKGQIPWNKGFSMPPLTKIKLSKIRKGKHYSPDIEFKSKEKHIYWKGGITKEYSSNLNQSIWEKARREVLQRDGEVCKRCDKYGKSIDHIIPWRISKDNSIKNLQVLCVSCNSKKKVEDSKIW